MKRELELDEQDPQVLSQKCPKIETKLDDSYDDIPLIPYSVRSVAVIRNTSEVDFWDRLMGEPSSWTENMILDHRQRWNLVLTKPAITLCRGCGKMSGEVCSAHPVCMFCDNCIQPYLANPRNEHHVMCRLPLEMVMLLYDNNSNELAARWQSYRELDLFM
jgi:hypothetical protein